MSFFNFSANAPVLKSIYFVNTVLGERAAAFCFVISGNLPLYFSWYKDCVFLTDTIGHTITNIDPYSSVLVVTNVTLESNGNYTCRVVNFYGSDEQTAILGITG